MASKPRSLLSSIYNWMQKGTWCPQLRIESSSVNNEVEEQEIRHNMEVHLKVLYNRPLIHIWKPNTHLPNPPSAWNSKKNSLISKMSSQALILPVQLANLAAMLTLLEAATKLEHCITFLMIEYKARNPIMAHRRTKMTKIAFGVNL